MLTIDDIRQLITEDESCTLELKKSTGELKDGMHSACAFLNTNGGWLIFGVTPKSLKIVGQQVTDNTKQEIANALSLIEPAVKADIQYISVPDAKDGEQLIVMHFKGYTYGDKPYTFNGIPYYKVESTTKKMPREMFEELLAASSPSAFAWERKKAVGVGIADLNEELLRGAVRLGVERGRLPESALTAPVEKLLEKLRLVNDGEPNNAAVMLFSNNIYEYPQLKVRMACFNGNDKQSFVDNQRAEGNFFELLDAGMTFLFKHLNQSGRVVGLHREEHLEIPYFSRLPTWRTGVREPNAS